MENIELNKILDRLNEEQVMKQLLINFNKNNKDLTNKNNIYLYGKSGIGKTTFVMNLLKELDSEKYFTYVRNIKKSIELFREENIPLQAELAVLQQQYGQITGAMTVEVNGEQFTLQQAGKFLESNDRSLREEVYFKIQQRRAEDKEKLNELFNKLLNLRNTEAKNAGFESYRDYRFKELGRFDYDK